MINTLSKLLGNSPKTISNWKKENREIIKLLYKYFSKEELEEFLETGKIKKFDNIDTLESIHTECLHFFYKFSEFIGSDAIINQIKSDQSISLSSLLAFIYSLSVDINGYEIDEEQKYELAILFINLDENMYNYLCTNILTMIDTNTKRKNERKKPKAFSSIEEEIIRMEANQEIEELSGTKSVVEVEKNKDI